jgi:photosystem II stability/assembly factor-like uncharacterized protein
MRQFVSFLFLLISSITCVVAQPNAYIQEIVNAVSQDSLTSYIGTLQSFGTRYEYTTEQELSATYILNSMLNTGMQAESDWYAFGTKDFLGLDIIDSNKICIVGQNDIIANSSDWGASWIVGTDPSPAGSQIFDVDFINPQKGWASGMVGKIYTTTDGGNNWKTQVSGVTEDLNDVEFLDDTIGIIIASSGKILRTSDGGDLWAQIVSGTDHYLRDLCTVDSSHFWAVGNMGTILFSSDLGMTWIKQADVSNSTFIGIDFSNANNGWIVGYDTTILKTTNGGMQWKRIPAPVEMRDPISSSFQSESQGYILDERGILFKTTDGGKSWRQVYSMLKSDWGPSLLKVKGYGSRSVAVVGTNCWIAASSDGGESWTHPALNLPAEVVHKSRNIVATIQGAVTPEKECIMVAHYDSYSSGNPTVTAPGANDNASGTSAVMEAVRILENYNFESTIKLITVSAEEMGLFGSTNYAIRAHESNKNIIGVVNGDMIGYPVTLDTARLIVGSYRTHNWIVDSALVYNQRYGIGLTLSAVVDNTGASDYAPFAIAGYDALEVAEATANEIWGGADPFYHTPSDSLSKLCLSLVRKGAQLMAATIAELAKPIGRITAIEHIKQNLPKRFCLEQNFPNPFNPTTEIRFAIRESGRVQLIVFDILGREVTVLSNKEYNPGEYSVVWDASAMPSGVYFCRLKSEKYVETKKMLLVK